MNNDSPFALEPLEPRRLLAGISPAYDPFEAFGDPFNDGLGSPTAAAVEDLEWHPTLSAAGLDRLVETYPAFTGAGQAVAVIDSGIDYGHPALGGGYGPGFKVVGGHDFVDDDGDPMDESGHGTAVAGVLAADPFEFDEYRVQGVAPGASLLALRVDAQGEPVPNDRLEDAFDWVLDHREAFNITAVNISLGYGSFEEAFDDPFFGDELADLHEAGVVVVSSAGNDGIAEGPGINYPAAHPDVVSVGSVDRFGIISEFSRRGALLDLLAPGEDVVVLAPGGNDVGGFSGEADGTSFSAPFAAGAAVLVRQADPALSADGVRDALLAGGTDNVDGDSEIGQTTGRTYRQIDVAAAVAYADQRRAAPAAVQQTIGKFGNENDLAVAADGTLHFAWFDSADLTLKYASRQPDGGPWSDVRVVDPDGEFMGQYVSIALDPAGVPSLAYFDGNRGDLRYARLEADGWQTRVLDSRQSVGLYPSLAFGADGRPNVAYYFRGAVAAGDLRLMRFDGERWNLTVIDDGGPGGDVGRSVDLVLDGAGRLNVAYDDTTRGHLKFARDAGGGAWQAEVADATSRGTAFVGLAFDAADRPHVSYYDAYPADLKFAVRSDSGWRTDTLAARGAQGLYTSLWVGGDGEASVLYYNRRSDLLMRARGGIGGWEYDVLAESAGRYVKSAAGPADDEYVFAYYDTADAQLQIGTLS